MSLQRWAFFGLFITGTAFAQLDTNSVTVTASRSINTPADQVVFGIFVSSDLSKSLDDIVGAVSIVGITQANFSSLSQSNDQKQPLQWGFALVVPLAKLKDTAAALAALEQGFSSSQPSLTLSFSVAGTQLSQTPPCPIPDLLKDAATQAQNLASGAGRPLGGILALSTAIAAPASSSDVSSAIYAYSSYSAGATPCSLTVKYALGN